MQHPFYTIGHGTRSIDSFVALLREAEVTMLADVRTVPRSQRGALAAGRIWNAISFRSSRNSSSRLAAGNHKCNFVYDY
jgi:uncharacterized protein (DUF488 family)